MLTFVTSVCGMPRTAR